jgi:hypothetical protein
MKTSVENIFLNVRIADLEDERNKLYDFVALKAFVDEAPCTVIKPDRVRDINVAAYEDYELQMERLIEQLRQKPPPKFNSAQELETFLRESESAYKEIVDHSKIVDHGFEGDPFKTLQQVLKGLQALGQGVDLVLGRVEKDVNVIKTWMMKGAAVCMMVAGIVLSNRFLLDLGSGLLQAGLMKENKALPEGQKFLKQLKALSTEIDHMIGCVSSKLA